jgi:hypothetical protein
MPNYIQPYPQGKDFWLQLCQIRMYNNYFLTTLGLTSANCMSFGRVQRNKVGGGYIPQAFVNGQFVDSNGTATTGGLFFQSGKFVIFWGLVSEKKNSHFDYVARMEMIVFADMSLITPNGISSTDQRLDEVLLNDLEAFITFNGYGWQVKETYFDIDKVLERYSGEIKRRVLDSNLSNAGNIQSFCALKLILERHYDPTSDRTSLPVFQNNPVQRSIVLQIATTPDLTKVIPVGAGKHIYQQYAPGNTITPICVETGAAYLTGLIVTLINVNNQIDAQALEVGAAVTTLNGSWNSNTGTYTANTSATSSGGAYNLNNSDFVNIIFTDLQ